MPFFSLTHWIFQVSHDSVRQPLRSVGAGKTFSILFLQLCVCVSLYKPLSLRRLVGLVSAWRICQNYFARRTYSRHRQTTIDSHVFLFDCLLTFSAVLLNEPGVFFFCLDHHRFLILTLSYLVFLQYRAGGPVPCIPCISDPQLGIMRKSHWSSVWKTSVPRNLTLHDGSGFTDDVEDHSRKGL